MTEVTSEEFLEISDKILDLETCAEEHEHQCRELRKEAEQLRDRLWPNRPWRKQEL